MPSTEANTVPDTQLGLTDDEIQLLRYHQTQAGSSSSRAASRASSQGRLLLDSSSLAALSSHLNRLMQQIQARIEYLSEQSSIVTMQQYDRAGNIIDNADAEIARFNDIMMQIDELELDFDRIRHIRDIVRGYRQRVEELDRELEHSSSSRRDRDGHHHHHHRHGHSHSHRQEGSSTGRRHHRH
ncbi:hypothetical protein JX265_013272 [Neoarthrinium moseri]|uniref:Biogenesis of lysosome-related organelles complex 1 subunit CNL1 n=1 Tax=Neoarthrinium moseri TaxID=1658444 RepID=A0A9P9W8V8_9PEZI|nr:uncharacterized protein JN550_003245 [Neoarthrinium moseri]KAI1851154.1 hypothetical protein JX265_013272 [Neoarthrinium moseri]KAI1851859.1 hypothetical protein JX266_002712 [Neoarthrinium moseri]KAI1873976.1 hypothetical protein JN550_003245 [Neoarthrinium moseri]